MFVIGRLPSYVKRVNHRMIGMTVVRFVSMSSSALVPNKRVFRDSHGDCVVQRPLISFPAFRTGTAFETSANRRLTLR